MNPPQGSLELLTDETARRILTSTEMAHLAYTWIDFDGLRRLPSALAG